MANKGKKPGNYAVGYGKPPKHTQFQKGRSGNPNGRTKGTLNLKTDLADELSESIQIREGNRQFTISKQRAVVKSLMAKAVKGDSGAAKTLLSLVERLLGSDEEESVEDRLSACDQEIIENYLARARSKPSTGGKTNG